MRIFCPRQTVSRVATGIALGAVLLISPITLRANDQKEKKKNAPASQPASSPKASSGSSSSSGGGHHAKDNGGSHVNNTGGGHPASNGSETHVKQHRNETPPMTSNGATPSPEHKEKHHSNDATGEVHSTVNSTVNKEGRHHPENAADTSVTNEAGKARKIDKVERNNVGVTDAARTNKHVNERTDVVRVHGGSEAIVQRRLDGRVREVHLHDTTIVHVRGGWHHTIVERPDHSRIVVNRFGHGYVQRPFVYRNREYVSRTYYYYGRPYAVYYRGYPYRGVVLNGYVPYRYYSPAFYGWAYHPWARPVYYRWGWAGSPWYGYYNYYFTPYPTYSSASFWLTDYLIASSLQLAYQERLASQAADNYPTYGAVALTPEVKQEIANEVQRQLALENSERQMAVQGDDLNMESSGLPRILAEASPANPRIFLVASPLDVTDAQGQECTLTEGDVLRLSTPPEAGATSASLQVMASKNQSCQRGGMVMVEFADLQEMQNHMRAGIDQGLEDLHTHQGGLPAPPAGATAAPVSSAFAPIAPPPDPNAAGELERQAQAANKLDQEVQNAVKGMRPPK